MAHKKAGGSTNNGRDSISKRLGVKLFGGQAARAGNIMFGEVNSAEIIFDRRTKRSRGYGFVEMVLEEDGKEAIDELNGSDYEGRQLRVDQSQPGSKDRNKSKRSGNRGRKTQKNPGGIVGFLKKLFN